VSPANQRREAIITRQRLLSWHRWTGAVLALFLLVQGLTGASLVFRDEIEPIVHPELRVEKGAAKVPIQELYDRVGARFPGATIARAEFPQSDEQAVLFKLKDKKAQRLAAIDPYTGRIVRAGGLTTWPFELLFNVHEQLLAGPVGESLIGLEGLGLLFILVTGPIVWWPGRGRIRQGLRMRWKVKADARWRSIHRAGGAIAAFVLLISATTGPLMVWKDGLRGLIQPVAKVVRKPTPTVKEEPGRTRVPLDSLVASAQRAYPTALRQLRFSSGGRVVAVFLDGDRSLRADGTNQVYYNVYDGAELGRYVAGELPAASEFIDWLFTVHTGLWGGIVTRLLMLAAGLALAGLAITGPWLWWSRTQRRRRAAAAKPARVEGRLA
jgi:uncharacterized iron-regulated membrane protein